jgi:hypothetical protein
MTKSKIEKLAMELFEFCHKNGLWQDVEIYFNGKSIGTYNKETREYYYYQHKYYLTPVADPKKRFDYVAKDHILSMSFEGPLYELINYGVPVKVEDEFQNIFKKYGLYFELGNAWNLTCYVI